MRRFRIFNGSILFFASPRANVYIKNNALIVQKLERTKGFAAVLELLTCGKYEKGGENYFKVLEKLTGINKSEIVCI